MCEVADRVTFEELTPPIVQARCSGIFGVFWQMVQVVVTTRGYLGREQSQQNE